LAFEPERQVPLEPGVYSLVQTYCLFVKVRDNRLDFSAFKKHPHNTEPGDLSLHVFQFRGVDCFKPLPHRSNLFLNPDDKKPANITITKNRPMTNGVTGNEIVNLHTLIFRVCRTVSTQVFTPG
jgi:hypothetical protein